MDLLYEMQTLLPKAIQWAERESNKIQQTGTPLTDEQMELARKVGVSSPEKVKVQLVSEFPFPDDVKLAEAARQTGFLQQDMHAITLGHSIYIREGCITDRLLSHELRHVYQYETFGSIAAFLVEYLKQIVYVGYANSLLELDARQHEIAD